MALGSQLLALSVTGDVRWPASVGSLLADSHLLPAVLRRRSELMDRPAACQGKGGGVHALVVADVNRRVDVLPSPCICAGIIFTDDLTIR